MFVLSAFLASAVLTSTSASKVGAFVAVEKPKVMLFISHDCPICNAYAPEIGRLERRFSPHVKFLLVYNDLKLSPKEAKDHAREFAIANAQIVLDPRAKLASKWKAAVTPQAIVFDSAGVPVYSGRIDDRYISLGKQRPTPTSHDLAKALEDVIAHRKPKPASGSPVGCFIVFPNSK